MDKNLLKVWTDALRSGEYKQGKQVMKDDNNRFCCLGVLADLTDHYTRDPDNGDYIGVPLYEDTWPLRGVSGDPEVVIAVEQWNKVVHRYELLPETMGEIKKRISSLNDAGFSFEELADIIEENADII